MALVPSRQLSLDSLQGSFSKFHGTPLHFFVRYNSSFTHLKPPSSTSSICQNPPRKSLLMALDNPNSQNDKRGLTLTSNDWFFTWNKPNKDNRPKPPQAALDYSEGGGGRGSTMDRIVEKLRKFEYVDEGDGDERKAREPGRDIEKGSVDDIFYVEERMLPNSRGGFSSELPLGVESVFKSDGEVRFPWEKSRKEENEGQGKWTARSKSRTSLAELTLPESELKRLRNLTYKMKRKIRVKGAVTEEVVNTIHERWKTSEIVRVKVEGATALNMKRVHEILERKTRGLVIWRLGTSISLYRGVSYEVPSVQQNKKIFRRHDITAKTFAADTSKMVRGPTSLASPDEMDKSQLNSETTAVTEGRKEIKLRTKVNYEDEVDKLLDGLGPRYMDWPGCDPFPVDADMLPGIVHGYQPPFRVLPYGVRPNLGPKEATPLRRLARVLPPHFALGRSRQLQGLAVAMTKLWEKSSIAKITLKRGVQLTTSERMAEDLKKLTGGILLSRNKDFLVFYRGKNFLSPDVTEALLERERLAKSFQDEEEKARLQASAFVIPSVERIDQSGTAGTLEETLDANSRWGKRLDGHHKEKIMREAEIVRHNSIVRKLEKKLAFAERRLMKAEKALSKVEEFLKPAERQADPESITDEERFMFRKLGLRMKAYLLLGRRGVFDGTVENMHLHWKYRELVKIILKAKSFEQVKKIALALEAESGGILVSVEKVSKGYAIIVFRGKDYKRPSTLRPKNLLTKRKALARSIEIQRREALLNHVSALHTNVEKLRSEIEEMDIVKDQGDEELYDKLDSAYHTDDGETEEEGDEAYLETYDSNNDVDYDGDHDDDETDNIISNASHGNKFSHHVQDQELETEPEDGEDEVNLENYSDDTDDYNDDTYEDEHGNDDWVQDSHTNFPYNVHDRVPQGS